LPNDYPCLSDRFVRFVRGSSLDKREPTTQQSGFGKRFVENLTCLFVVEIMPLGLSGSSSFSGLSGLFRLFRWSCSTKQTRQTRQTK